MNERVKTILIVSIVSVIIWIYAEGESLSIDSKSITLTLPAEPANLTTGTPVLWFEGDGEQDPRTVQAQIVVEGSAAALDSLDDALQTPIDLTRSADFPAMQRGEPQDVQLLQVLRSHAAFRDRAVTITSVEPPTASIRIDTLQSRQLDVEVRLPEGFQLTGPVRITPERVTLYAPQSEFEATQRTLSAVLPREQVAALAPGIEHVIDGITLPPPAVLQDARFVRIDPPAVSARFTLQTTQDEHTIPSVYFWTLIPESETGKWNIDIDGPGFLRDVKVIGPGDQIARLKADPPELDIRAIIELSADDLLRGVETATARFSPLPTTLRFDPPEVEVRLTITPADGDEPEPPNPG